MVLRRLRERKYQVVAVLGRICEGEVWSKTSEVCSESEDLSTQTKTTVEGFRGRTVKMLCKILKYTMQSRLTNRCC
jgi:hypothetical protein